MYNANIVFFEKTSKHLLIFEPILPKKMPTRLGHLSGGLLKYFIRLLTEAYKTKLTITVVFGSQDQNNFDC